MSNKVFKKYMEDMYNIDRNYEQILSKERKVVSMKRKILNVAAIFLAVIIVGVTSTHIYAKIKWDIEFKEYQNRIVNSEKGSLQEAKENGYAEIVDMNYISQDGISIKIDSLLLTDDYLDANVTFKFDKNVSVDSDRFSFGFAIYDENKNIYGIYKRMNLDPKAKQDNTTIFIYEDLGVKYNKKDIYAIQIAGSMGIGNVKSSPENRTITANITLNARDSFPRSKKLYIRIFNPGYTMVELGEVNGNKEIVNAEDFQLSKSEWNFEIDVPEKFYERQTIELKPKNEIPGIEISKISLTEAGMKLKFTSEKYNTMIFEGKDMTTEEFEKAKSGMLAITDANGKIYKILNGGTTMNKNEYSFSLDVNKNDLENRLFINYKHEGTLYTEELIIK